MFLQDCLAGGSEVKKCNSFNWLELMVKLLISGDLAGVKEALMLGVDVNCSDGKATALMKVT